jgi:hypothetical protein
LFATEAGAVRVWGPRVEQQKPDKCKAGKGRGLWRDLNHNPQSSLTQ